MCTSDHIPASLADQTSSSAPELAALTKQP